jgi:hypothetical protein
MIDTIEKTDMELKDDVIAELKYEPIVKVTDIGVLSTCAKLITHIKYYNISKLSDCISHKLLKCLSSEKSIHYPLSY